MQSINPYSEAKIAEYEEASPESLTQQIALADEAFQQWRSSKWSERKAYLAEIKAALLAGKDEYAALMTCEMGKPIFQARAEIDKCAWLCGYYHDHAEEFLQNEPLASDADEAFITYQPLGVILGIMPWNFPFWQVFRFAVPTLMAGNTVLLKHASNVGGCAEALANIFTQPANAPDGVYQPLMAGAKKMEGVIADSQVRAVSLTGSTEAGRKVAALAGQHLKKCVLELGGSDAYIVLRDADINASAALCAKARLVNNGQSCIAAKRFIIEAPVYEAFIEALTMQMREYMCGDPLEASTQLGPMASAALREELHRQVTQSAEMGATIRLGGFLPAGKGFAYPPTILTDVSPGMPAYDEELFGPVAVVMPARDEEEAVKLANDTPFGLGGAVLTGDSKRGKIIAAKRLNAGMCFVNAQVASDPRLPFGGIGDSGYGRELAHLGIREFVNIKTVSIQKQLD